MTNGRLLFKQKLNKITNLKQSEQLVLLTLNQ